MTVWKLNCHTHRSATGRENSLGATSGCGIARDGKPSHSERREWISFRFFALFLPRLNLVKAITSCAAGISVRVFEPSASVDIIIYCRIKRQTVFFWPQIGGMLYLVSALIERGSKSIIIAHESRLSLICRRLRSRKRVHRLNQIQFVHLTKIDVVFECLEHDSYFFPLPFHPFSIKLCNRNGPREARREQRHCHGGSNARFDRICVH